MLTPRKGQLRVNTQDKRREHVQDAFLAAYAQTGTIQAAADAIEMDRNNHYRWLEADLHEYRSRWEQAQATFTDSLEALAFNRLTNPEGNRGSDVLLITMLNAHRPDKYKRAERTDDVALDTIKAIKALAKDRTVRARVIEVELGAEARTDAMLEARKAAPDDEGGRA